MAISSDIKSILIERLGTDKVKLSPVGGGSINETFQLQTPHASFFVKCNNASKFPHLFKSEAYGLKTLKEKNIISIPNVIDQFETNGYQVLLLEWIQEGKRIPTFWKHFGEQLARLHHEHSAHFGLDQDNYMGSVPQKNQYTKEWESFYIQFRITPLLSMCVEKRLLTSRHIELFNNLFKKIGTIFNHEPPSLLHGDLWSGNFLCNQQHQPVLIDPAIYYGHRSVDLGMTTLFGGFHETFYDAYHYHFPLPPNYKEQWKVCNLYPLLIHLFLFGRSYLSSIESTLQDFQ